MSLAASNPANWLQATLYLSMALLAVPSVFAASYLLWLTLFSRPSRAPIAANNAGEKLRFDIIVPAHDEELGIAGVVDNLLALDWPRDQFRVIVVADNCSDGTAERARQAGALVLERHNLALRGKGYALVRGFSVSLAQHFADVAVVVDADSQASRNLLRVFAQRMAAGALATQVFHGVLNPDSSPRHRLMTIAYSAFHRVRSRGRESLGLSCGIRGNGWCVSHGVLRRVTYAAHGLAEDIEYGLRLGLAGIRVEYIDEAQVLSSMDTDATGVASQRNRWEQGRSSLPQAFTRVLLAPWPATTRALRWDLGLDLLVPPLATIGLAVTLLFSVSFAGLLALPTSPVPLVFLSAATLASAALGLHVARGWQLSGTGLRGLRDLASAPRFALWKLMLRCRPGQHSGWVRTRRITS
jgi:hypothetical protein